MRGAVRRQTGFGALPGQDSLPLFKAINYNVFTIDRAEREHFLNIE